MCDYSKREQAMVIVRPGVWCDPCLVPLVRALYENGFPTVASCCGHGNQPPAVALADGRWVVVMTGAEFDAYHEARAQIREQVTP